MHFDDELPGHISEPPLQGVVPIPYERLSAEALQGIIEEFIAREGTDYGDYQYSFADKREQVLQQLKAGRAVILFDPESSSCQIELTANVRGYF